jgi:flagellar hook-associated protein 1 FlgK
VDNLAYTIAEKVNLAHRQGYDRYNNTNMDFFELSDDVQDCSRTLKVREDLKEDVWKIAAAGMPDAPGDNRVANLIGSLQHEKWMDEGKATFNDFFNGIVSQLAVHIRHANDMVTYQNNIVEQLKHVRENISGVNLDEEMVKMIEYQKAFDASAKLIRTADEMLETVLNIKR